MDAAEAYRILGVDPQIADDALSRAYRDLVKVWHPDRFGHDDALRTKANDKLSEINRAYRLIQRLREEARFAGTQPPVTAPPLDPEPAPTVDPTPATEPAPPSAPARRSGRFTMAAVLLVLLLVGLAAGAIWWLREAPATAPAPKAVTKPERGKIIADSVRFSADDFVVDLWHNGERVPYSKRDMKYERFGAAGEHVSLEVREGDWIVFNVVNNRMRWGGAHYFGVVGIYGGDSVAFVSSVKDGRWTYTDDTDEVKRLIADRDFRGKPVDRPTRPWHEGNDFMKPMAKGKWTGDPIWGGNRNTWIKFVALPATNPAPSSVAGN